MNDQPLRGVVHGRTIELEHDAGLPDGQSVTIVLQPVAANGDTSAEERFRRCFGAWAEDAAELDDYLDWTRQHRKVGRWSDDS